MCILLFESASVVNPSPSYHEQLKAPLPIWKGAFNLFRKKAQTTKPQSSPPSTPT